VAGYVYLIKNGDLYKIGRTDNLERRLKQLQPCEVLATLETDRSRDLEADLHKEFKAKRIPQTEYFRLDDLEVVKVKKALDDDPFAQYWHEDKSAATEADPGKIRDFFIASPLLVVAIVVFLSFKGLELPDVGIFALGIGAMPLWIATYLEFRWYQRIAAAVIAGSMSCIGYSLISLQ